MSTTLEAAAHDFLAHRRIAVAGVSRTGTTEVANTVYRKLRDRGYGVVALNPSAEEVEGDPCYPDVASVDGRVDGVFIATAPEAAPEVVRSCMRAGVPRVWMHRSFGAGSVSEEAVALCREAGIAVIPGACPMMFLEPDVGHRCMRWLLKWTGGLPDASSYVPEGEGA